MLSSRRFSHLSRAVVVEVDSVCASAQPASDSVAFTAAATHFSSHLHVGTPLHALALAAHLQERCDSCVVARSHLSTGKRCNAARLALSRSAKSHDQPRNHLPLLLLHLHSHNSLHPLSLSLFLSFFYTCTSNKLFHTHTHHLPCQYTNTTHSSPCHHD